MGALTAILSFLGGFFKALPKLLEYANRYWTKKQAKENLARKDADVDAAVKRVQDASSAAGKQRPVDEPPAI